MIIIDWNCQGGFRDKYTRFLEIVKNWDVLVIQECEEPEYVKHKSEKYYRWAKDHYCIWKGENKNKGIGFFSKQNNLRLLEEEDGWKNEFPNEEEYNYPDILYPVPSFSKKLRYIYPLLINNYFVLIGIGTKKIAGEGSTKYQWTGLITAYLELNKYIMENTDIIIVGDFNNNIKMCSGDPNSSRDNDTKRFNGMVKNFSDFNNKIISLYHRHNNIEIGKEDYPTCYYSGKNIKNRPDHIDYCFVSERFHNSKIRISENNEWEENIHGNKKWGYVKNCIEGSDHCPLIIEI
jgi:exonuclease III